MPLGSWLPAIGGLASAWAGYKGAKDQAQAIDASNELAKKQFDYELAKQQPIVEGGGRLIDLYGTENDPFSPFVGQTAAASDLAQQVGGSYLANVQPYQEAGVRGVQGLQALADTAAPADVLATASAFRNPFIEETYQRGLRDIDRQTAAQQQSDAALAAERGSLFSGQAARRAAETERQRTEAIGDFATKVGSDAYNQSLDQARRQQAYQQGLGTSLIGAGGTGLTQATTAQNLASTAGTTGIGAGFQPLSQYGALLGYAPQVQAPQVEPAPNSLQAGLGAGIRAWNAFQQ